MSLAGASCTRLYSWHEGCDPLNMELDYCLLPYTVKLLPLAHFPIKYTAQLHAQVLGHGAKGHLCFSEKDDNEPCETHLFKTQYIASSGKPPQYSLSYVPRWRWIAGGKTRTITAICTSLHET